MLSPTRIAPGGVAFWRRAAVVISNLVVEWGHG
jgi:hypothetical protein